MAERGIEVKVGALILVSVALLVVFVLVLGRVSTKEGFQLNVLFVHPGALTPGAPVKIAGGEVGYVEEMTYLGNSGPLTPVGADNRPRPVRTRVNVKIWVEESVRQSILADAHYYVTQQGILGESFLEIAPGNDGAPVQPGGTVYGTDPPRLDEALANGASSLETINRMLTRNEREIDQLIASTSAVMKTMEQVLVRNEHEIENVIGHADDFLVEGRDTLKEARKTYIDNPRINRTLTNLDSTVALLAAHDDELVQNLDRSLGLLTEVLETVGPDQQKQLRAAIEDLSQVMSGANTTVDDVEHVMARLRRGEGAVGALLTDEEVYDDLRELIRDLKHNPWKFFWRE